MGTSRWRRRGADLHGAASPAPEFGNEPYAVAIVELPEGVRIFSRIVADPASVHIGMPVRVEFAQLPDGFIFPVFMEA